MAGTQTIIQTPTPDIVISRDFYLRLGYRVVSEKSPLVQTDGNFLVEINPERTARKGIKIIREDCDELAVKIGRLSNVVETERGFLVSDPNGVFVFVESDPHEFQITGDSSGLTGNFAGVSIESTDLGASSEFWQMLGFEKSSGEETQGWISFSDGNGIEISLMKTGMCPHLFSSPGLNFFNSGKNLENINAIREAGIAFAEEISIFNKEGIADNAILVDPGGLMFFVFND
ncbi:MAG: hypothetical protein R2684_14550 [Pyrinomonadaceae bacterium]